MPAKKTALKIFFVFLAVLVLLLIGIYLFWKTQYSGLAYPGTKIGDISLSGKTSAEINELILEQVSKIEKAGLNFENNGKLVNAPIGSNSFDSGINFPFLSFDVEETTARAFDISQNKSFFKFAAYFLKNGLRAEITPVYSLEQEPLKTLLKNNFSELIIAPENAYFSAAEQTPDGTTELINNPEKIGKDINYTAVFNNLKENLNKLQNPTIIVKTESKYPSIGKDRLEKLRPEAEDIINSGSKLILRLPTSSKAINNASTWKINAKELISLISIKEENDGPKLFLDQEKIKTYLQEKVAPAVDQESTLPKFEINNGKVSSWQTGKNGQALDLETSAAKITTGFLAGEINIELIIKEITADSFAAENNLQIKEIIGTGHSSFKGSSVSRIHNIRTGANSLHGLLIKPGEEFSLINNLGNIDGSGGYKTELVIKGDKTTPEFGGGLCQVGTTMFRTALASGLPITMRQNHSYRVSYYEPAGTDATIYDPWPDFRFVNDTGNYILIQSRMAGNDLYFDFWGTSDGRIATTTYPVIYNIVKPEPTKLVETDSLKPGEKKCTESSHNGADAYFDYKVIYPEGATTTPIMERRFKSHYVPWRAVCLIGKTATSTSSTKASSTINNLATTTPKINTTTTP
jgi:vancomycin resistance protein YoaR